MGQYTVVYFDEVSVFWYILPQHIEEVSTVLEMMRTAEPTLKLKKRVFSLEKLSTTLGKL